jgi:hypothetical protein
MQLNLFAACVTVEVFDSLHLRPMQHPRPTGREDTYTHTVSFVSSDQFLNSRTPVTQQGNGQKVGLGLPRGSLS